MRLSVWLRTRAFHILTLVLASSLTFAPPVASQNSQPEVVYDWSSGAIRRPKLHAGQIVRFSVEKVNPLCYRAGISAQVTNAEVDVSSFVAGMTPAPAEAGAKALSFFPSATVRETADKAARAGESTESKNRRLLENAVNQLEFAHAALQSAEAGRAAAAAAVEIVTKPPCEAGRGFSFDDAVARWSGFMTERSATEPLAAERELVSDAESALTLASQYLSDTRLSGMGELVQRAARLRAQRDSLSGQRRQLAAALTMLEGSLKSAGVRLQSLSTQTQSSFNDVELGHNVEKVKVTVHTYPVPGSNAPAVADAVAEVPVHRRYRPFLSTGVLVTSLRQPRFAQVRRQHTDAGGVPIPDSTYLTYVNREGGPVSAFSPAVQLNVALVPEPISALVSFGASARSVNGSTGVEPFIALSAAVLDRLVGSFGVHWGRQERLLIGDENVIKGRPVPSAITRDDAVGTRWNRAFAFSFSVKP